MSGALVVEHPGLLALVQDAGRPGFGALGVGAAGAADRDTHDAANRLAGNAPHAAAIELLGAGAVLRALGAQFVVVTGDASVVVRRADGAERAEPPWSRIPLGDGDVIELPPASALRRTLAVRGGVAADPVLGSRSRDTLAALGPAPLTAGEVLPVAADAGEWPLLDLVAPPADDADRALPLLPGPRRNRIRDEAALFAHGWTVTPSSDRVGLRLAPVDGPPLEVDAAGLASEGMVPGALQVPPSGQPVLFLVDHPVTGGYPVPFVLASRAIGRAARLVPGTRIRFVLGD